MYTYKTMHQQEQKLQNMHNYSLSYQLLKKLIQLAISFSLLSILFLHPCWQSFFQSLISHVSTFSSRLFVLATDKNYIFLLCNGILVFIAKYSSHSVDNRQPQQLDTIPGDELVSKAYRENMQPCLTVKSVIVENFSDNEDEYEYEYESQTNAVMPEDDAEDKYVMYQITDGTVMEKEVANEEEKDEEEFIKEEFHGWTYEAQVVEEKEDDIVEEDEEEEKEEEDEDEDEEEEEEGAIAKMSTEELNRKFDDFIRRMKEELRIEAQRQLIMV